MFRTSFPVKFIRNILCAVYHFLENDWYFDWNKQIRLQEALTSIYNLSQTLWVEMKLQPLDWYIYTPQYNECRPINDTGNDSPYDSVNYCEKPTYNIFHFDTRRFPLDKPI